MKCTIPGPNMKVFGRAMQALSRVGDEIYVEPEVNSLSLRTVNSSRSGYFSFTFNRPFFSFYKYEPSLPTSSSQETSKCKLSTKSILPVFRSPAMLDRKVENCLMLLKNDGSQIIFEMKFRNGCKKTHILPIIECETLQVVYDRGDASNCIFSQVRVFVDVVQSFQSTLEEITLSVTSQKIYICSYLDASQNPAKTKSTKIELDPSEFDKYEISKEASVTFCLKEFRPLVTFAESIGDAIIVRFGVEGKPVVFEVKHENTYDARLILSTLSSDLDSVATAAQQMRQHTSNTPSIDSAPTVSEVRVVASTSRQNQFQRSHSDPIVSLEKLPQEIAPDVRLCSPKDIPRPSVRRGDSPSLLTAVRSTRSSHNNDVNEHQLANLENRSQVAEKSSNNLIGLKEKEVVNDIPNPSNHNPLNNSQSVNNRTHISVNNASQVRTSNNCSSTSQDFTTPSMDISSTMSLNVRESDDEDNDTIPPSLEPPRRRPKLSDIFDATFDPNNVPGYDIILVEDSGDEDI